MFQQHDISIAKRVALVGRANFAFRIEMLNAFNHVNFAPPNEGASVLDLNIMFKCKT